jgi:hypothetical protein
MYSPTALAALPQFPTLLLLGIVAKRLDIRHKEAVAVLCQQCGDFLTLVAGRSPTVETAPHLLESRPPGVELDRKYVIGFERGGELIGIVDLLEDYPGKADWYVGLLLLSPEERARGL